MTFEEIERLVKAAYLEGRALGGNMNHSGQEDDWKQSDIKAELDALKAGSLGGIGFQVL